MNTTQKTIACLNSLHRGELAATETYQQAMEKVGSGVGAEELRHIHHEHRTSANTLREYVRKLGGKPDQDSGAWGTFAKTMEGAATLFGSTAALKVLKEGEEHGVKEYKEALEMEALPAEIKSLIRTSLLPQTESHLATLDRLMSA